MLQNKWLHLPVLLCSRTFPLLQSRLVHVKRLRVSRVREEY